MMDLLVEILGSGWMDFPLLGGLAWFGLGLSLLGEVGK